MTHKHLDLLFKKALRYEHHQENFQEIISNDVTPFELRIKKTPETEKLIEISTSNGIVN